MKTKTKVVAVLLALVVLAGVGSAALLTYYGKLIGTSDLQQSVLVCGGDWMDDFEYVIGSVAGNTYINGPFPLKNQAEIPAYVSFDTLQEANYPGNGLGFVDASDAVDTFYGGLLKLENKDPKTWLVIGADDIGADLNYTLQGNEFCFELEGKVPLPNTKYTLIYYMDQQDRFVNWGGDRGMRLGAATSDSNGNITMSNCKDIEKDLPFADDWNAGDEADYGDFNNGFDDYDMRTGAKLWLVPIADLTEADGDGKMKMPLAKWNPRNYLFETDLIAYHDTDDGCGLRLGANSEMDMYIKNVFEIDAMPGAYKITTTVVPETACPTPTP